jgi:hypothetical protein
MLDTRTLCGNTRLYCNGSWGLLESSVIRIRGRKCSTARKEQSLQKQPDMLCLTLVETSFKVIAVRAFKHWELGIRELAVRNQVISLCESAVSRNWVLAVINYW